MSGLHKQHKFVHAKKRGLFKKPKQHAKAYGAEQPHRFLGRHQTRVSERAAGAMHAVFDMRAFALDKHLP